MAKQQYLNTGQRHVQNVAKHLHIVQRITGFRANHFLEIKSDITLIQLDIVRSRREKMCDYIGHSTVSQIN